MIAVVTKITYTTETIETITLLGTSDLAYQKLKNYKNSGLNLEIYYS